MPFFHYTASDRQGKPVEGTIQASSPSEAGRLLSNRGFNVRQLVDTQAAAGTVAPPPTAAPVPSRQAVQAQLAKFKGTDKQRYFLFAQMAAQLRAGIAPANAFPTLAGQISNAGFAESLRRIATLTADGRPMSEVMGLYPGLYPDHVVGLVRAGEVGGFLPEACAAVSEQAGAAHKFRIWHWFLWVAVIASLLFLPAVCMSMMSFNDTFIKMWKGNEEVGSGWVLHTMLVMYLRSFVSPVGLTILAIYAAISFGLWLLNRPRAKRLRHSIGFRFPGYGRRATNEGITMFSWALGLLSRGGVAPQTSWALAADCVPNAVIHERLVEAGRLMRTDSRVSEAAFRSGLFPEEYAPTISTGEMVGDLPGALERLAQVSRAEYDSQTQYAKFRAGCWGVLIFFGASILGFAILYYIYGKLLSWMSEHGAD
jgi:type II secretory pathway component PulF